ncbi:hypothetical protein V6N11_016921 [Hibiscus sabdariffa]|uniref:Transposase n=1 Tax=Hibiscus sabdariffa TaxID=183260 RepID=A0ABR2TWE5_9ROSI
MLSKFTKIGLYFLVDCITRYLKKERYAPRYGTDAPIYLFAILQYIAAESTKAGLRFPMGCIIRYLKKERYAPRYDVDAPVYLFIVLQYIAAEIS